MSPMKKTSYMKRAVARFVQTGLIGAFFAASANSASGDMTQADSLYRAGDMAGCARLLETLTNGAHKTDANAHYLLANAYLNQGKTTLAKHHYRVVLQLTTSGMVRNYASQALAKLNGSGPLGEASRDSVGSIERGSPTESGRKGGGSAQNASLKQLGVDPSSIDIVRRTQDTDPIYNQLVGVLSALPKKIRDDLVAARLKFKIAPTMPEARPDLRGTRPRGYTHGGGYDNTNGLYQFGTVYIAERESYRNSPPAVSTRTQETVFHELGHAYDDLCGPRSSSDEFKKAYDEDSHHLTNTLREKFYYYVQESSGPSELFAELFAVAAGGGGERGLSTTFPKCHAYVQALMKK